MTRSINSTPGIRYILDNEKYPVFIKNHIVFQKLHKIDKVFPGIGLPNISEDCLYFNSDIAQNDAHQLMGDIRNYLYPLVVSSGYTNKPQEVKNFIENIKLIYTELTKYYPSMLCIEGNKYALKFINNVGIEGKYFIKKGEGLFKAYTKLVEEGKQHGITLPPLDTLPYFKRFSASNIPSNIKFKIVFSSNDEEGAWDIATISMRGISSCQTWGGAHSVGLIGSITNKYVGVIYITDGSKLASGTKMVRRALVRFCINKTTKKPALLMDKIYPVADAGATQIFIDFLKTKTNLPVIYSGDPEWASYILTPDSFIRNIPFNIKELTYMDTRIPYKNDLIRKPDYINDCNKRIDWLDRELPSSVHSQIIKLWTEYLVDRKAHKELFEGGLANLITSLSKRSSSFSNYLYTGGTLPPLRPLIGASLNFPAPELTLFTTPVEYEKHIIYHMFRNLRVIKEQSKTGLINPALANGIIPKFYKKSVEKLHQLVILKFKQELIKRYASLKIN